MADSYRSLRVWQDAMRLTLRVYRLTDSFPKHELYGLVSQMRRAAVSVPSNIAEGKGRRSDAEVCQFLFHARGSLYELETQLELAFHLGYACEEDRQGVLADIERTAKQLHALINHFTRQRTKSCAGVDIRS